jgi:hypothetical protein
MSATACRVLARRSIARSRRQASLIAWKARTFFFQPTMQRAWRQMHEAGDRAQRARRRQHLTQRVADAQDHFPVTPVQGREFARCTREEGLQRSFVATDRQFEQVGRKGCAQLYRVKGRIRRVDERIIVGVWRARVRESDRIENDAAPDKPGIKPMQQAQQPFEGEHPADRQGPGVADAQERLLAAAVEANARSGRTRRRKRTLRSIASASVGAVITLRQRNSKLPQRSGREKRPKPSSSSSRLIRL